MDVLVVVALVLFVVAVVVAALERSWPLALVAAGLAFEALAKIT